MIKEELRKEIEKEAIRRTKGFRNQENCIQSYIMGATDFVEKRMNKPEMNLKIVNCIKSQLCKQDEDYDRPIISPKFLSDILDQMLIDGFEILE